MAPAAAPTIPPVLLPEVELTSELLTLVFEVTVLLLLVLCQILH